MAGTCVLFSGGLDSAVLLALEQRDRGPAQPVHVRSGFAWEDEERYAIDRLLEHPAFAGVSPVRSLAVDLRDVYPPEHWAIAGTPPAYDTPDEDVYLEGRNITLISKAAVLCARMRIHRLALGPLANNPFPDASQSFFDTMARAMSLGTGRELAIATPLTSLHKDDVIKLGAELGVPMELSMSCMNPRNHVHCGACSKCRERRDAFAAAGVPDRTAYAVEWTRT
jgi:7-cyano-7-deazaguanine synthase